MEKGQDIVWDSGFYYSKGTYVKESKAFEYEDIINIDGQKLVARRCELYPIGELKRIQQKYGECHGS